MTTDKDLEEVTKDVSDDFEAEKEMSARQTLRSSTMSLNRGENVLRMDQQVSITFHKMDLFMEMFPDQFTERVASFHASLSPKFNRDSVFKSGEGAGRSGSFFFFSHDRKFIIKTMTQ